MYFNFNVYNIRYDYFMIIKSVPEYFLQNDDDVSCVIGVTGITGISLITKDHRSDLSEFCEHAVEEAATKYKRKHSVDSLYHLQDFMHAISHDSINWEDLTNDHMNQYLWVSFATYMGKYARNKTMMNFHQKT